MLRVELELPKCACGCGSRVAKPGNTVIHGHNAKMEPYKAQLADRQGTGFRRKCDRCRAWYWVIPSKAKRSSYCSVECANAAKLQLMPQNRLQERLWDLFISLDPQPSWAQFCRERGLKREQIRDWYRVPGRSLPEVMIGTIADLLGIPLDQAIDEAGGTSDTKRREVSQQLALRNFFEVSAKSDDGRRRPMTAQERRDRASLAGRQSQANRKDQKWSEEHGWDDTKRKAVAAKAMATKRENGAIDRAVEAMAKVQREPESRRRVSLQAHLLHDPKPDKSTLKCWAKDIESRFGGSTKSILDDEWKPILQARGLWRNGGRKPDEERHQAILEEQAKHHRSDGRLPRGARDEIAKAVSARFSIDPPWTAASLYNWMKHHRPRCQLT